MAGRRQLVLRLARRRPSAGGERGVLAHGQPGARFGVARDLGARWAGRICASALRRAPAVFAPAGLQQDLAQLVVDAERRVARGVRAAGDRESVWPRAILLAAAITACRPVPQACWMS